MNDDQKYVNRQMKLYGANCPSCIYTIEKFGRKIRGVKDIKVNAVSGTIELEYLDDNSILSGIKSIVNQIGYDVEMPEDKTI